MRIMNRIAKLLKIAVVKVATFAATLLAIRLYTEARVVSSLVYSSTKYVAAILSKFGSGEWTS